MNARWAQIALLVAGAVLVGAVLTLEVYFNTRATHGAADLIDIAIPQFGRAAMWAALVPLILRLRELVPLARGTWAGGMSFHLAVSFGVMAVFYLGRMWAYTLWFEPTWPEGFWRMALQNFYGRNIIDMTYYWAVIAFGYGLEYHQRYKDEELKASQLETRLVETELQALRQQLHPHFLFNTLNTIAVLVRERRSEDAVNLIARLSALLRLSLDQRGVAEVTLQQELEFIDHYVEIQKVRFSDRLTVQQDIAPEVRSARIPHLLLQPLVENAIVHGIAPKSGPGRLEIAARRSGADLLLEVRDDGPGLPDGRMRAKEGVGLCNTRERLARLYGARAQLSLQTRPGRGVCVQVVLPYRADSGELRVQS
ncbi:sensor histidine kinase [Opitutus terrae]|uniref:Signal transduction histidine kinase, LytS n=1 Tax=Opitutus terrae (strain DSM 11246 / JCM 15787 / PB90-1) TaxID=452637 RepID=B1ZMA6_OPITP|nr:histidine kinase [Opitutus terrae]ACB73359.1 signal transduction histidine kinase, LytS [Opitutus terrae PB90-1]